MDPDIYGTALQEYHQGISKSKLITYLQLPGFPKPLRDNLPLDYLFRSHADMPPLEHKALSLCRGHILDIGAGAGPHSLYLQAGGMTVTALDRSAGAAQVCRQRGLRRVIQADIQNYSGTRFDTVLLLMNGLGLAGSLSRLSGFLEHLRGLLRPGGQILAESSDIRYMYEDEKGQSMIPYPEDVYYGEGSFVMEYGGRRTAAFPWLYIDFDRLSQEAQHMGMDCVMIDEGTHYDYLAQLTVK